MPKQVVALISAPLYLLGEGQRVPQMLGRMSELPSVETHAVQTHLYVPGVGPVFLEDESLHALESIKKKGETFVFVAQPVAGIASLLDRVKSSNCRIFYDRFESWKDFPGNESWYNQENEQEILDLSDGFVSTYEDELFSGSSLPTLLLKNAASDAPLWPQRQFRGSLGKSVAEHSSVVYVGSMDRRYIDMDTLKAVGDARPGAFYGAPPGMRILDDGMSPVRCGRNGWFVGWVEHKNLSYALASGDLAYNNRRKVGLLPFLDIPLTKKVSPIKWWEYLLAGVRPISMNVEQVKGSFGIYASNADEFLFHASTAAPFTDEEAEEASEWVKSGHMWKHRAKELNDWLEEAF
jgi:hypothetical protein